MYLIMREIPPIITRQIIDGFAKRADPLGHTRGDFLAATNATGTIWK
jgi:hypothetical protein